jgi:hypothetical protein
MFQKAMTVLSWILLAMLFLAPAFSVTAQAETPSQDAGCLSCHESLYQLYDTGKSFCLCAERMTCTCCHGGNPESVIEAEAHQGMVLNPVHEDAAPCQKCHPDDADAHIEKFAAVAGFRAFHATRAPAPAAAELSETETAAPAYPLQWLEAWQWTGLGALALALVVLIAFGYRCWKADCLAKIQKPNS